MSELDYFSKGTPEQWAKAREAETRRAGAAALAEIERLLGPEPEPEEKPPCDHEWRDSPRMLHTLECIKCGHSIEHPKRTEVHLGANTIQPADRAHEQGVAGLGTDGGASGAGEIDFAAPQEGLDYSDLEHQAGGSAGGGDERDDYTRGEIEAALADTFEREDVPDL